MIVVYPDLERWLNMIDRGETRQVAYEYEKWRWATTGRLLDIGGGFGTVLHARMARKVRRRGRSHRRRNP